MTNTISTIGKKMYIHLDGIAPTQAAKIGALRFGNRNDCNAYLNSTSLSILNEKSISFLYAQVNEGFNTFEFSSGLNCIRFKVTHFSKCCGIATLRMSAALINLESLNYFKYIPIKHNYSTAQVEIKYTIPYISNKAQDTNPHKALGIVKLCKYDKPYKEYDVFPYTLTIR